MYDIPSFLQSHLGAIRKNKTSKGQIAFDCPNCEMAGMGKGNLEINYHKDIYNCWACGNSPDGYSGRGVGNLLYRVTGSIAVKNEYKSIVEATPFYTSIQSENQYKGLPKGFKFINKAAPAMYLKELEKRRISLKKAFEDKIGYVDEGVYGGRLVIPSVDMDGAFNYYITRTVHKDVKPKYLNAEADKYSLIFNEPKIDWDSDVYIVEGYFDGVLFPNPIIKLGKSLSPMLLNAIKNKLRGDVYLCDDADAEKTMFENANMLSTIIDKKRIKLAMSPEGMDYSKLLETVGWQGAFDIFRKNVKIFT